MSVLHVVFKVGGADYALDAAEVLQMESFSGATQVPGSPSHVAGIIQVRGRVIPVVDLRVRFGLEPAPQTLDSRVVIVERAGRPLALLVDSAREVLRIDPEQFRNAPDMVTASNSGFVRSVAQAGSRLLMLLDLSKVIAEERTDAR